MIGRSDREVGAIGKASGREGDQHRPREENDGRSRRVARETKMRLPHGAADHVLHLALARPRSDTDGGEHGGVGDAVLLARSERKAR